jgi:hypothetical protein
MAVRQKRAIMKKHGLLTEEDRYRDRGVHLNAVSVKRHSHPNVGL